MIVAFLAYLTNKSYGYFKYWLVLAIISTLYSLFWDIFMDWGFYIQYKTHKTQLIERYKINYLFGSIIDTILRGVWVLTISYNIIA